MTLKPNKIYTIFRRIIAMYHNVYTLVYRELAQTGFYLYYFQVTSHPIILVLIDITVVKK